MLGRTPANRHSPVVLAAVIIVVLLLLYAWTLTETVPITVSVENGVCTASAANRSGQIECPGVTSSRVGVYVSRRTLRGVLLSEPLALLSLPSAWEAAGYRAGIGENEQSRALNWTDGEQQPSNTGDSTFWSLADESSFTIEGHVRRPDGQLAGIVLLEPGSDDGWVFVVNSVERQGIWRRWHDGQLGESIRGMPYQKPLIAQVQSLVRKILDTFLGTLVIVAGAALIQRAGRWIGKRRSGPVTIPLPPIGIHIPVMLIVLSVFGAALWIAVDLLEGIPHVQDSITFLFQAQTLARGELWAPAPAVPAAFAQEFLMVVGEKWFGQYPPGYASLLSVGVVSGAPWLVSPLLAALNAALLYKLGALFYRKTTGLLAAALALFSPFFMVLSGSLMVHSAELFWTLLAMTAWAMALRAARGTKWALLAGAALGMLLITRQITAVIVVVWLMISLFIVTFREEAPGKDSSYSALRIMWLGAAALPFLAALFAYQGALTGSPLQDPRLLSRPFDRPGFGPQFGERENAFRLVTVEESAAVTWYLDLEQPPRGHSLARGLYNTERNFTALARHLFGWPALFALSFCWMPFLIARPSKYDLVLLVLQLAVIAAYVTYWTTGLMYGPRYYFAALPALLLLTARGMQLLAARFGLPAAALIVISLMAASFFFYWPAQLGALRGYNFIDAGDLQLAEAQIEGPAVLFVPVDQWWDYGRFFSANTPWLDGEIIYARDLGEELNDCLRQAYPGRTAYIWEPESKRVSNVFGGASRCPEQTRPQGEGDPEPLETHVGPG